MSIVSCIAALLGPCPSAYITGQPPPSPSSGNYQSHPLPVMVATRAAGLSLSRLQVVLRHL